MSDTTFEWYTPRTRTMGSSAPDTAAQIACRATGSSRKLIITLPAATMQQLGWTVGEHFHVGVARDRGAVAIRRTDGTGYKARAENKQYEGQAVKCSLTVNVAQDFPLFRVHAVTHDQLRAVDENGGLILSTPWLPDLVTAPTDPQQPSNAPAAAA